MKLDPASLRLQVVSLERLRLHEEHDPWRARRLEVSLRHQGVLKNPVIVVEKGDIFIVLDGATRASALRGLAVRDVLVQIVRYDDPTLRLDTWHHVLVGLPSSGLITSFGRLAPLGSFSCDLPELHAGLNARRALFGLVTGEERVLTFPASASRAEQIRLLGQAVAAYRGRAEVHRAVEIDLPALRAAHPGLTAVVVFPPFTPDDVIHCANNATKLPMGVTRHVIVGRALGLNVPLEVLARDQPLEEKNAWLLDRLAAQLQHNRVRLYEEPTFVFDD